MTRATHQQTRWRSLTAAPPGLVSVVVWQGECLTDRVLAIAIRERWESPLWDAGAFDPERDRDFDEQPVCLVLADHGLDAPDEVENFIGIFEAADLTPEYRAELVRDYERTQAHDAAVRARRAASAAAKGTP